MFLAVAINGVDRVNFSVAIPAIRREFGFSLQTIGTIAFVWGMAYAIGNFSAGWLADRLGLRSGIFATFGSAVIFMLLFVGSFLFLIDRPSYTRLIEKAAATRLATA
jgi:sugar phosphate permease